MTACETDLCKNKRVGHLVLDTAPFIQDDLSTLRGCAHHYYTTAAVIAEIKDAEARRKLELWESEISKRVPNHDSVQRVVEFAKKTGDYDVLSAVDIQVIALTLQLDCQHANGSVRLRKEPLKVWCCFGKSDTSAVDIQVIALTLQLDCQHANGTVRLRKEPLKVETASNPRPRYDEVKSVASISESSISPSESESASMVRRRTATPSIAAFSSLDLGSTLPRSYDDGWITPSNVSSYSQSTGTAVTTASKLEPRTLKVACATSDFAMQNVLLQMGLNVVNPSDSRRIRFIKSFVMRCHACYKITKDMSKRFCPTCGGNTLLKTTCSGTTGEPLYVSSFLADEEYPIPATRHGSANGKGPGNLVLREDQKEYQVKIRERQKERDVLDPDWLPGMFTGEREKKSGWVQIGHGKRNPNQVRNLGK
ncbi:20S-pre-rRNA D-site endonuclease nob1 [Neolecta irregularis DAH-3]|uniref:20S-pre-rRNA D-site endonuclease NOB1 n=1 Tax=Neolecta irregularis (strain DAH-3) TaxID=1198029 RepID=A0A1U7LHN7_NEOID|nr:20S-pre-rRNA D-site endonuclease nob1 [Neolecta irregularis DAH-3]|eukprot:OLL22159.1 20S-pre-rRNA D-site endonuclease nob1 [Neolecta irregularis DAH-3]